MNNQTIVGVDPFLLRKGLK